MHMIHACAPYMRQSPIILLQHDCLIQLNIFHIRIKNNGISVGIRNKERGEIRQVDNNKENLIIIGRMITCFLASVLR